MDERYFVIVLDGHWIEDDYSQSPALAFYDKTWDEMLQLLQWATAEGYEVAVSKDPGGGG